MNKYYTDCTSLTEVYELTGTIGVFFNPHFQEDTVAVHYTIIESFYEGASIDLSFERPWVCEYDLLIKPEKYMFTTELSVEEQQYLEILYGSEFVEHWITLMKDLTIRL